MKTYFSFILLILAFYSSYSQGEGNIWYFGNKAGLDFNNGNPVALTNSQMNTEEGCAAISTSEGQLLFYTDGIKVWNKNHQLMPNGTGLLGNSSSSQSGVIVPKPEAPGIYYIFTNDYEAHPNGFRYSIVDLNLDGGLGDITDKNILLFAPSTEKVTAVKNTAGDGFWVLTHGLGDNNFYAYSLTASGLNTVPVTSSVGSPVPPGDNGAIGYMKLSPDGTKLVCCTFLTPLELFDFDAASGIVSNPRTVNNKTLNYGAEFSPSGNLLYITTAPGDTPFLQLYQYNLNAPNIPASASLLYMSNQLSISMMCALQLAPNGKIYVSLAGRNYLGAINNPEITGSGCSYQQNVISLGTGEARIGLPQFVQSYFNVGILVDDNCLGEATTFTLSGNQNITSATWDFGDFTTSTNINPTHSYSSPGTYTVSVNATNGTQSITKSRQVIISATPAIANNVSNQDVCGDAGMNFNPAQFNSTLLGTQSTTTYGVAYFLSAADANSHAAALPSNYELSLGTTAIFAKVYNLANKNCNAITSFNINLYKQPIANQPSDYVICENLPYNNIEQFDLSTRNTMVLNGQSSANYTISYHASQAFADAGTNDLPLLYTNTNPQETIYARIGNNLHTACFAVTSFQIQVIQQPVISTVSDFMVCDDATNNGMVTFDLSQKTTEILNGQSPAVFEVEYFNSDTDAQAGNNNIIAPISNSPGGTIYYSIGAIGNDNCKTISSFNLIVSSLPVANSASDIFICDDTTNDGIGNFNLQENTPAILGAQAASQFTVSYHSSQSDADANLTPLALNYQNLSNPQTIFARIENTQNPECFTTTPFLIGLHKMPTAGQAANLFECDDQTNDGIASFDLTTQDAAILGAQNAADYTISYHLSQQEADTAANPVAGTYNSTGNLQTIYARIANSTDTGCYATSSFTINVKEKPSLDLEENYSICQGKSIRIDAPPGYSSYSWSNGGTGPSTIITQSGNYSLTVTKDYGDIICDTTKDIVVYNSNIASITKIETRDWTNNQNSIAIFVTGDGDYEYSVDGYNYQGNPEFYNLPSGQYIVYVNDKKGCGTATEEIFLLMYPNFFTPNGDGFNDVWKIKFSILEPDMELFVFDRYGKLLYQFNGKEFGWDGRYNGHDMPSNDYWFLAKRQNGKEYRGHFSLKR